MEEIGIMRTRCIMISILFYSFIGVAQIDDPGIPGGDPDVPIDNGVVLLLIVGTAYGLKKIRNAKR